MWGLQGTRPQSFTMRPASTVGTSVSLLPSPTPNSCSFPELSRLGVGRKRVRRQRQHRDAEAEAAGEGCACRGGGQRLLPTPTLSQLSDSGPRGCVERLLGFESPHPKGSDLFPRNPNTLLGTVFSSLTRHFHITWAPMFPLPPSPTPPHPAPSQLLPTIPQLLPGLVFVGALELRPLERPSGAAPGQAPPPPSLFGAGLCRSDKEDPPPPPSFPSPARAPPLGMDTACPRRPAGGGLPGLEAI